MSYITVEVDIDHGKIIPRDASKLPALATGLLTIVVPEKGDEKQLEEYVPLIKGTGKPITILTREELDAILWGD
jgi:hypothetical protein